MSSTSTSDPNKVTVRRVFLIHGHGEETWLCDTPERAADRLAAYATRRWNEYGPEVEIPKDDEHIIAAYFAQSEEENFRLQDSVIDLSRDGSARDLLDLLLLIDRRFGDFSLECSIVEYTDTGDVWDTIDSVRELITEVLAKYGLNDKEAQ